MKEHPIAGIGRGAVGLATILNLSLPLIRQKLRFCHLLPEGEGFFCCCIAQKILQFLLPVHIPKNFGVVIPPFGILVHRIKQCDGVDWCR